MYLLHIKCLNNYLVIFIIVFIWFLGYFQFPIDPRDVEKIMFTCPYGTFFYRHMRFGLCNAPASFHRHMTAILHEMVEKFMEVFMDNFLLFSHTFDNCLTNINLMLARYKRTNLVLNREKCHFMVKEDIVLGHKVSELWIEVDQVKIDIVSKLPPPSNKKGVWSFLGQTCFFCQFLKDFSKITLPLTQLLLKYSNFDFSDDCLKVFNVLNEKLTTTMIMIAPNWNLTFEFTLGGVLGQELQPIYYASKTLNKDHENYTMNEKEILVFVYAFDKFHPYLTLSKTVVFTNHTGLKYLFRKHDAKEGEIDDIFPDKYLMVITGEETWFAGFVNFLANGYLLKVLTKKQRRNFSLI